MTLLLTILLLGAPQVPSEPGVFVTHGLIGSYIVASAMDGYSSMFCLGAQTCREVNPLLRPLEDRPLEFAAVKTAVAVGVGLVLIKYHKKHPKLVRFVAGTLTASGIYIAVRNTRHRK